MDCKKCNKCGETKPVEDMTKGRLGVIAPLCKQCKSLQKKALKQRKIDGCFVHPNSLETRAAKFIADAVAMHGGLYTYGEADYIDAHTKVKIFCTRHQGYFWQTPTSHLMGSGCFECGIATTAAKRKYSKEDFVARAMAVHGDKYEYLDSIYVDCFTTMFIRCKEHGYVEIIPTQHLSGRGCKHCAKSGYSCDKPGHLYILTLGDFTKVGITNNTPEDRAKVLSRSHQDSFEVIHSAYWEDGNIANDIETLLLRYLSAKYSNPDEKFHGWTETFLHVDRQDLLNKMKEIQHDY